MPKIIFFFRISNRQPPRLDSARGFELITPDPEEIPHLPSDAFRGVNWLPPVTKRSDVVRLQKQPAYYAQGVDQAKQNLYLSLLRNGLDRYGLQNPRTSQFIAFKRIECGFVNEICVPVYNDHTIFDFDKKVTQILIGDKIMVSKNSDVPVYIPSEEENPDSSSIFKPNNCESDQFDTKQIRLMNGSVYMIEDKKEAKAKEDKTNKESENISILNETVQRGDNKTVIKNVKYFLLDDLAEEYVRPNCKAFARNCKPCHAYALTIHKFQGSEADTIVYGVSNSKMETWKHVYTAVTRGKKRVVIVGTWENLVAAVKRKSRSRQTTLQEKMCKVLAKIRKGEELDIEEDKNDEENDTETTSIDENSSPIDDHLNNFTKRIEQASQATFNLINNDSSDVIKNNPNSTDVSSGTRKRENVTNSKTTQCNNYRQCKTQKCKQSNCDIFPDDSFNDIVSQMPESELQELTGENTSFRTPTLNRTKDLVKHGVACSTPKVSDSHNESSFEIQMSQMNDSQFKRFLDDS
jgi:hypothetical protein